MMSFILRLGCPLCGAFLGHWFLRPEEKGFGKDVIGYPVLLFLVAMVFDLELKVLLFASILLSGVITDGRSGRIYHGTLYLLLPLSLVLFYEESSYISGLFMCLVPLYKRSKKCQFYIGEGDVYVLLFLSMAFGRNVFFTLFYASCLGLLFSLKKGRKEIYFMPFLFLGFLLSQIERLQSIVGFS